MKSNQYLYLFTLEVAPLVVGETYNPLPSHLTLMSRFWTELPPEKLSKIVERLLRQTKAIQLIFGQPATLGPKQVAVHLVENTEELKNLHSQLYDLLNAAGVTYTAPQFFGDGHKPHVTKRKDDQFTIGYKQMTSAAYLIEVEIKGDQHLRHIRTKFDLKG